jgi:hypothetical protein
MQRAIVSALAAAVYLLIHPLVLSAQSSGSTPGSSRYTDNELSFRYAAPSGMEDETEDTRAKMRAEAAERRSTKVFTVLLALGNGAEESSPSWRSLTIQTFPRNAVSDQDDLIAEEKMNGWVAGLRSASPARQVVLSGQHFAVSAFGAEDGNLRKGVVVWTTIRKGKLLSFAFAANSASVLQGLTLSMKTVQFF